MRYPTPHADEIKRLADGGVKFKDIAERLHVSTKTVRRHAGHRSRYRKRRTEARHKIIVGRCPKCGAKVSFPCLACLLRSQLAQKQSPGRSGHFAR